MVIANFEEDEQDCDNEIHEEEEEVLIKESLSIEDDAKYMAGGAMVYASPCYPYGDDVLVTLSSYFSF